MNLIPRHIFKAASGTMRTLFAVLLQAALVAIPTYALAQPVPPIPKQDAAAHADFQTRLVGIWTTSHHTGFVYTPQSGLFAFPPSPPEPITLAFIDGALVASSGSDVQHVVLEPYSATNWTLNTRPSQQALGNHPEPATFEQVALMAGCSDINELPRLIGTTNINQQGLNMRFVIRLIVLSEDLIHGILIIDGAVNGAAVTGGQAAQGLVGFESWRSLTMMRWR